MASGKPPLVVNSATEVPRLNAGPLDGQPATGFIHGTGQVVGGRATEADNGGQGFVLDFTDWDLRGTCYNTGGRTDLVTHASFGGTLNVVWWDTAGVSTATLAGGRAQASIVPLTTNSSVAVIQMDEGGNLTTIIATQTFNSGVGTCTFTAHDITSG